MDKNLNFEILKLFMRKGFGGLIFMPYKLIKGIIIVLQKLTGHEVNSSSKVSETDEKLYFVRV